MARLKRLVPLLLGALPLAGQGSELPLALNLPTPDHLEGWDVGVRFTHRFQEQARSNGKDLYGLDGGAFSAFGLDFGIGAVPGLNAEVYRTADRKTFTVALQERLLATEAWSAALRAERFDETIEGGRVGSTVQLPVDWRVGGGVVLSAVPSWLSSSFTERRVGTVGLGARWLFLEHHGILGELYPRPSKVDGAFERGFALGYQYRTLHHRFTLLATNEFGTTAYHVLGGDYEGLGPSRSGNWNRGFNLVRVF